MKQPINPYLLRLSKKRSRQGLYEFLESHYSTQAQGTRVLSVGSGGEVNQLLEKHAKINQFEIKTIDIDSDRNPDIIGDICSYDFCGETFNTVVMSEVLEHLHSPQSGLDTVYKILNPGGKLILSTPFIFPIHDEPYDYFRFTKYGLELLLKKFKVVEIRERNSYFETIDVLWLRLLVSSHHSARIASYFIIPFVYYLIRPLTLLLTKLIPINGMTTGYTVTAFK